MKLCGACKQELTPAELHDVPAPPYVTLRLDDGFEADVYFCSVQCAYRGGYAVGSAGPALTREQARALLGT